MPLLSAPEEAFVRELTDRCHSLLRETYPHGAHFAESVRVGNQFFVLFF